MVNVLSPSGYLVLSIDGCSCDCGKRRTGANWAGSALGVVLVRGHIENNTYRRQGALYAEIDSVNLTVAKELIKDGYAQPFYRQVDFLFTDIYNQHAVNIGLLTEEETEAVISFYSLAKTVRSDASA